MLGPSTPGPGGGEEWHPGHQNFVLQGQESSCASEKSPATAAMVAPYTRRQVPRRARQALWRWAAPGNSDFIHHPGSGRGAPSSSVYTR